MSSSPFCQAICRKISMQTSEGYISDLNDMKFAGIVKKFGTVVANLHNVFDNVISN